jgi:hypothetical protein
MANVVLDPGLSQDTTNRILSFVKELWMCLMKQAFESQYKDMRW